MSVAYSPDNEHFASSSADGTVKIWKESEKACVHTFTDHTDQVSCLALYRRYNRIGITENNSNVNVFRFWKVLKAVNREGCKPE